MSGRNTQVARILKVVHLLEITPQGYTVAQLTEKMQGHGFKEEDRTIRRDLEVVEQFFPLVTEDVEGQREKRYKMDSIAKVARNVSFSVEELIALYLSRESMNGFKSSPLFQHITSFYEKLEKTLGYRAIEHLAEMKEKVYYSPMASWQGSIPQEIFDTVYRACEEGHVVEVLYTSLAKVPTGKTTQRRLGPEGVYFGNGGAYLIAKDLDDGEIKLWSFGRIREAKWTDVAYKAEHVDIASFVDGGIGVLQIGDLCEVVIQVAEPIASYVSERRWHKSQNVIRNQEGISLTLQVKVNDELARWVLSLGPAANVVKPQALRDRIAVISEEIAKAYRKV
jgi:predicted DNA-binding transcriptional regulator YafY